MKKFISGWGRHPTMAAEVYQPYRVDELRQLITSQHHLIARGNGRSYGDSALAASVASMLKFNCFIDFDAQTGKLTCEAGVLLAEIIHHFLHRGWFLPVTAGTKYITVGGAIASDVHGKNHHHVGCFSQFVASLDLLLASGEVITCSQTEHADIFHASCGGMGLTGIILRATIQLQPVVGGSIAQTLLKARHLDEIIELFDQHAAASYSVAWIDCLASGHHLGRSLLMLGEHHEKPVTFERQPKRLPVNLLAKLLNRYSIKWFNSYYYHRPRSTNTIIDYNSFFYPLDHIANWNLIYGSKGFIQYQFVLPTATAKIGMKKILQTIVDYRQGSFLAVLKKFGRANSNLLSFPIEGLALALDFKMQSQLPAFIQQLDAMVDDYGGRVYLTKDACLAADRFASMYPNLIEFSKMRVKLGAEKVFNSAQSMRLNL